MEYVVPCTGSDTPELLRLMNEFFPYIEADFASVLDRLHDENFTFLKFHYQEQLLGYIEFESLEERPSVVRLNGIAVRKDAQGQGVGKDLMLAGMHAMHEKGFEKIFLLVAKDNATAKKLYSQLGFQFHQMHEHEIAGKEAEEWECVIGDARILPPHQDLSE
ncbi:MAG: GNAT family N-acetyltransferase [Candidatus Iainarchaeum archaeon]|uniref:GNAT family N-acetyltransferase n=1 Tax=Candidatus Iainarchaeum sp. TaxID=3101447 RepID=A0A7T9DJF8_9ARCH|nr:MAG: GNAT family N-acetyltransferase [Candidatus Diapherotrites archaeon]